jgi:NAD(P)-dependent dehydrogenase (short-subunit alcohol dehydrogenase family)
MAGVTFDIRGEVCVITGGGSGIGRALCNACATAGASAVVAVDFDLASAEETIAGLPTPAFGNGFKALAIYADCGKEQDIIDAVEQVEADVGPIGSFMANAGIAGGPPGIAVTDEQWDLMQGVNVMQHIYMSRCVVPRMIARGGGSIVITASAAGLLTQVGSLTYSVTKAAAVSCAEWLSITHGADGIAVSCLCPQGVATNLGATSARMRGQTRQLFLQKSFHDHLDVSQSHTILKRKLTYAQCMQYNVLGDAPPAVELTDPDQPGVAAGDGVLTAEETAQEVLRCIADGCAHTLQCALDLSAPDRYVPCCTCREFLVLPHREVRTYMERKAKDTDRWINGMRRLNNAFGGAAVGEARRLAELYNPKL